MAMIDPLIDAPDDRVLSVVRSSAFVVDLGASRALDAENDDRRRFVPSIVDRSSLALPHTTQEPGYWVRFGKRPVDCLLALLLTVGLSPLLLVIALIIKMTSPGSVFFRQVRVGKDGVSFRIWKFRTMVDNAELLLKNDAALGAKHNGNWKIHNDPRVTRIGKFLRKTSLDELPQLFNVIKGEMSLIGPRPVQPNELVQQYGALAPVITSVRPGMTGLWQISGRSLLAYHERVQLDIQYVVRLSFVEDSKIFVMTIPSILRGHGAV